VTWGSAFQACAAGLGAVFAWPELGFLVVGVLTGAMVGILPGLGGAATLALVLPFSLDLPATQMFALLIGIAAVTSTTGDLTSILVGIPGESTSTATVVDGHPMAVRGEAGRAIAASLVSSLAGSIVGALTLALTVPLALGLARAVGSPELFMLALLGISFIGALSTSSRLKGLATGGLGLMLATIGFDRIGATPRFTFGQLFLWDGVGVIPVALGLLAIPEVVEMAARRGASPDGPRTAGSGLSAGVSDARRLWRLVLQSSVIGTFLGLIPGVGAGVSQWVAYGYAARRYRTATGFGEGAVEGVIAPSAANNASLGASLVPALALGVPGGLMSAVLIGALLMKGLVPGPTMLLPVTEGGQLTLVFAFVWLIVVANVVAVALTYLSSDWLTRIALIPGARLSPFLLLLIFVGAFTERQAIADLLITAVMGALGLVLVHFKWPRAPLLLGLVLGPLAENRLFLSIDAYGTQWLTRPGVLALAAMIAAGVAFPLRNGKPRQPSRPEPTDGQGRRRPLLGEAMAARLAPHAIAAATIALVVAAFAYDIRGGSRPSRPAARLLLAGASLATSAWVPVYLLFIWGLGFVVGGPLAVFGYLVFVSRERLPRAALLAGGTWVFLYVVLSRLLQVAFPSGSFLR
jgi:TctA family transporter